MFGRAAQRPQRVLQPSASATKTLAAKHQMGVREAGEPQPEVVEHQNPQLGGPRAAAQLIYYD